jgi:hypothetical protein
MRNMFKGGFLMDGQSLGVDSRIIGGHWRLDVQRGL